MPLTRNQFLILLAVLIASCGAWGVVLKMFLDSSLAIKWACSWWFFGGCLVAAVVVAALEYTGVLDQNTSADDETDDYLSCAEQAEQAAKAFTNVGLSFAQANKAFSTRSRRCSDIKIEGDINPLLIAMKSKLTEVKQAAEKGIDRE